MIQQNNIFLIKNTHNNANHVELHLNSIFFSEKLISQLKITVKMTTSHQLMEKINEISLTLEKFSDNYQTAHGAMAERIDKITERVEDYSNTQRKDSSSSDDEMQGSRGNLTPYSSSEEDEEIKVLKENFTLLSQEIRSLKSSNETLYFNLMSEIKSLKNENKLLHEKIDQISYMVEILYNLKAS